MAPVIATDPVPLRVDAKGTIRIGNTRVTLDIVIAAFLDGLTAEEITEEFSTLDLGDVYSVLGYYLHHKDDVDDYLRERQRYADEVRAKIEARHSQAGLREQLLARLQAKQ
jgi:uncharacterized protein (DUF433 family)